MGPSVIKNGNLSIYREQSTINYLTKEIYAPFIQALCQKNAQFVDQTALDTGMEIVNILMLRDQSKLTTIIAKGQTIPSIQSVYNASFPAEREVYDMFGVLFTGAFDLRRLLSTYGFIGHPLLKQFPLIGTEVVSYQKTAIKSSIVFLTQDLRNFGIS
jgi:NADH:ubiquinone oxidoreductase subunit C